jgi:hypothetical protein
MDDIIDVIAAFCTIVALPVAIYYGWVGQKQAKEADERTTNVTQAKKDAETRLLRTVEKLEVISSLAAAIPQMEEIRRLHRRDRWPDAIDLYGPLRNSLNDALRPKVVSAGQFIDLKELIDQSHNTEDVLRRCLAESRNPEEPDRIITILNRGLDTVRLMFNDAKLKVGE